MAAAKADHSAEAPAAAAAAADDDDDAKGWLNLLNDYEGTVDRAPLSSRMLTVHAVRECCTNGHEYCTYEPGICPQCGAEATNLCPESEPVFVDPNHSKVYRDKQGQGKDLGKGKGKVKAKASAPAKANAAVEAMKDMSAAQADDDEGDAQPPMKAMQATASVSLTGEVSADHAAVKAKAAAPATANATVEAMEGMSAAEGDDAEGDAQPPMKAMQATASVSLTGEVAADHAAVTAKAAAPANTNATVEAIKGMSAAQADDAEGDAQPPMKAMKATASGTLTGEVAADHAAVKAKASAPSADHEAMKAKVIMAVTEGREATKAKAKAVHIYDDDVAARIANAIEEQALRTRPVTIEAIKAKAPPPLILKTSAPTARCAALQERQCRQCGYGVAMLATTDFYRCPDCASFM